MHLRRIRRARRRPSISEAIDGIGQEAALVGGALESGGTMSAAEHRLFVQTVDNQRLLEQLGTTPS